MPRNREEADLFFCSVTPLQNVRNENCDVVPQITLPGPSAPMVERGRKRQGRCCLRRSSSCCASCTAGSRFRDRAKHLKEVFAEVSRRVWDTFTPDRRSFAQRLRSLRQWAAGHLTGTVQEKVLDLCGKRDRWSIAYRHPGGHRTSNMLDRLVARHEPLLRSGPTPGAALKACRLHFPPGPVLMQASRPGTRRWRGRRTKAAVASRRTTWPAARPSDCWVKRSIELQHRSGGYRRQAAIKLWQ